MAKENNYSRETAANLLGISTRTLDRYLKSNKIKSTTIKGRVRIFQTELEEFGELLGKRVITEEDIVKDFKKNTELAKVDNSKEIFYKDMYEMTKTELYETQKRLELVNYRLGQTEEQLRQSVPLLEYKVKKEEVEQKEIKIEKELIQVNQNLKIEKISKWIFAVLLFGMIVMQPILWILSKGL